MSRRRKSKKQDQQRRPGRGHPPKAATSADVGARFGVQLPPNSKIISGFPGMPKMSDQLTALIDPYVSDVESNEAHHELLTMGVIAWNVALQPAKERAKFLAPLIDKLGGKDSPDMAPFLEIVDDLVRRKESDPRFAGDKRYILNFQVFETAAGPRLEVLSAMPSD